MYLFTISYGSHAVDQRSGDGWISGWSQIFALYQRNSWTRFWGSRRENCSSTEPNHPLYLLQEKGQSWGNESSKRRPLPPRKTDRLPDLRVLPGQWGQWFCRELCRPSYSCSSKWWYSGIRFEMGRNSKKMTKNHLLTSWKDCTNKNTRVWETQDRIGIVQYGDSSQESWTWLSQIEENAKKKFRAEFSNEEFWGQKRKLWKTIAVAKNQGTKQHEQRSLGDCWQWKADRQCSKGDNCSFRHDMNKRAKSTQPNPSPRSCTQQSVRNASSTRSPGGRSPSGKMAPLHSVKSGILQNACSTSPKRDARLV